MPERKAPAGGIVTECLDTTWQTPPELIERVRAYFGGAIPFDAATAPDNPTRARAFATEADNGLALDWSLHDGVWCNPPYGKVIRDWLGKMEREARAHPTLPIIALLPAARWEQGYFQAALAAANALCLIRRRVRFIRPATGARPGGNPYANLFVGWNVVPSRWVEAFARVGACFTLGCLAGPPGWVPVEQGDLFAQGQRTLFGGGDGPAPGPL